MKPHSIRLFDGLFLASIALSVLATVVFFDRMTASVANEPELAVLGGDAGALVWIGTAISAVISLILWLCVSRLRSVIAKWVLVVLTGLGVFVAAPGLVGGVIAGDGATIANLVAIGLQLAAVAMLFRADAKAWLAGEGAGDPSMVSAAADDLR